MTCPELHDGGYDFTGLTTAFQSTYSMYSDYTASASLQNPLCELGVDIVNGSCIPLFATIECTAQGLTSVLTSEQLLDCYSERPRWVAGLLTGFGETQDGISDAVDLTISSYFERLSNKPISTYLFSSNSAAVVQQLLDYFAGIPAELYNLDLVVNPVLGSIDGGSVMDAIKLAAQACMANVYVQVGGVLEIARWKDHNSIIDLVIPSELMGPVSKRANQLVPRLAVLVRGAKVDTAGCGERVVSDARTGNTNGGLSSNPGASQHTAISGIDTKQVQAVIANLNAAKKDLEEAQMLMGGQLKVERQQANDGNIAFVLVPDNPAQVIGPNGKQDKVLTLAAWRQARKEQRDQEKALKALNFRMGKNRQAQLALQKVLAEAFKATGKPSKFPASAMGGMAGGPDTKAGAIAGNLASNQQSNDQLSAYAFNNNVGPECGNSFEEIENTLVASRDVLFRIAVRRHQEILMDNNTFQIELNHYIPCLRLNQVVQFQTPGTSTCPPRTVRGLVTEINTNYTAEGSAAKMSVAVADLTVLGQTEYTSSNLLEFQCGGGGNGLQQNPWEASALSMDSNATIQDMVVTLYSETTATITYAYLNQWMQQGQPYTLTFQYQRIFGTAPLFFNNTAGGGATLPGPVGTYTENFTAAVGNPQFRWYTFNPLSNTMWKIFNISLTRTVIA